MKKVAADLHAAMFDENEANLRRRSVVRTKGSPLRDIDVRFGAFAFPAYCLVPTALFILAITVLVYAP